MATFSLIEQSVIDGTGRTMYGHGIDWSQIHTKAQSREDLLFQASFGEPVDWNAIDAEFAPSCRCYVFVKRMVQGRLRTAAVVAHCSLQRKVRYQQCKTVWSGKRWQGHPSDS